MHWPVSLHAASEHRGTQSQAPGQCNCQLAQKCMSKTIMGVECERLQAASGSGEPFCLVAAVVAAAGGDDLFHAVHDSVVAHQSGMVHQPELLVAWSHAHAGQSPSPSLLCCCCTRLCRPAAWRKTSNLSSLL